MNNLRTPPPAEFKTARLFNRGVAGLLYCLMLAFALWLVAGAMKDQPADLVRALAGAVLGIAALVHLMAVHAGWRSGEPFQHSKRFRLGLALFGIGAAVLVAGLV